MPAPERSVECEAYHAARERILLRFERRYLQRLEQLAGPNKSLAARIAGIDRTTLYRLMQRHQPRSRRAPRRAAGAALP